MDIKEIRAEIHRQQLAAKASWDPPGCDLSARVADLESQVRRVERFFDTLAKREVQDRLRINELEDVTGQLMN